MVVTGMGKSGLIGRKIAATFSSTGTPSFFLHPAEALHGDLGMLASGDVVLALSYGGETEEIVALLPTLQRLKIPIVALTGQAASSLAARQRCRPRLQRERRSVLAESCADGVDHRRSRAGRCSRGFIARPPRIRPTDFAALHPSGRLGKKLMRVESLMHSGDDMPRVAPARRNARRYL